MIEDPCDTCAGSGRERRTRRYNVKIPAGVKDGTRIRLKGKGEPGAAGGPAGDLFVVTRVASSPLYERRGADLVIDVPVTYPEAALGATVEVPTPYGERLSLKVAPGSEDGKLLRMRGHGAPNLERRQGQGRSARAARRAGPAEADEGRARGARAAPEGLAREPAGAAVVMDARPRYMISVAADIVGMHPQTLRMYEQKGLVRPRRTPGNTRLYSERDLERLRLIQRLTTELGLNLAGVELVLGLEDELRKAHARIERLERQMREEIQNVHRTYRRDLVLYESPRLPERQR